MNILTVLEIWAVIGPLLGVSLGLRLPRKALTGPRTVPSIPVTIIETRDHRDELLVWKDGQFVPLDPPQYVEKGVNPTAAARAKAREHGVRYHTRRTGD